MMLGCFELRFIPLPIYSTIMVLKEDIRGLSWMLSPLWHNSIASLFLAFLCL